MYHGVRLTVSGGIYGWTGLLDLDDPGAVLLRGDEWVLAPEETYEREATCTTLSSLRWIVEGRPTTLLRSGGHHHRRGNAKVSELLDWLHQHSEACQ